VTTRNSWYRIVNLATAAEIYLYDEVGLWGVSAQDFTKELRDIKAAQIDLHINSPGGDVFDGMAIYTALRGHPATVTAFVDSIAASAASFIAMAGDRIVMRPNSQIMIHMAHGIAVGNADDMEQMKALLDRQTDNIASVYARRAGGTVDQWRDRMRAETWYSADEAVAAGLADEVRDFRPAADMVRNDWDLSIFNHAGRANAPNPLIPAVAAVLVVDPPEPTVVEPPAESPAPQPPEPPAFDPDAFRLAVANAAEVDFDPAQFRDLMVSMSLDAPAPPRARAAAVDLGPMPEPATVEPEPPLNPWEVIRAATRLAAMDAPVPPQPHEPESPAEEPGFFVDAPAFRSALRRATQ